MMDVTLRCVCGCVELEARDVAPERANRVTCECEGCQQAAKRWRPEVLDARGGTERFQVSPASVHITRGADRIACAQQTPRGAYRWYASCCQTPLVLTLRSPGVPFVGLEVAAVSPRPSEQGIEEALGPMRARVNATTASRAEARALKADGRALRAMLRHLGPLVWRWWRCGAHKRSPFFGEDGAPVVEVERLHERALVGRQGCR